MEGQSNQAILLRIIISIAVCNRRHKGEKANIAH